MFVRPKTRRQQTVARHIDSNHLGSSCSRKHKSRFSIICTRSRISASADASNKRGARVVAQRPRLLRLFHLCVDLLVRATLWDRYGGAESADARPMVEFTDAKHNDATSMKRL